MKFRPLIGILAIGALAVPLAFTFLGLVEHGRTENQALGWIIALMFIPVYIIAEYMADNQTTQRESIKVYPKIRAERDTEIIKAVDNMILALLSAMRREDQKQFHTPRTIVACNTCGLSSIYWDRFGCNINATSR